MDRQPAGQRREDGRGETRRQPAGQERRPTQGLRRGAGFPQHVIGILDTETGFPHTLHGLQIVEQGFQIPRQGF